MAFTLNDIDESLIALGIKEDLGPNNADATTDCLFQGHTPRQVATIYNKHPTPITVCGLALVEPILQTLTQDFTVNYLVKDGRRVTPNQSLCSIHAPADVLLKFERLFLNFARHLSAIATLTNLFVAEIESTQAKLLDTRKTIPGMRHLEKYAVACGRGINHRMGLYDAIMIKDTHVDLLGGMENALNKLPEKSPDNLPVIVEVRDQKELKLVIEYGENKVDRVLLDNMREETLKQCVELAKPHFTTEASGNIRLDDMLGVAQTGVDFISVGYLTHSAGSVDLSMRCERTTHE